MGTQYPTLNIMKHSQVSPPPGTIGCKSLPLTFFDILWLDFPILVHTLFFYDLPITKSHFTETIVLNLKQSLSNTLQHFFPFVGKLIIFPTTSTRVPEIRYAEGDSVTFTTAECKLDFKDLVGNHPRDCGKFYQLVPSLRRSAAKVSDYITFPVFSVQVTLFPNHGISIGMTNHHSLGDANTTLCFRKAWASIARSGSDASFLASETSLPIYERLVKYPELDEIYLKRSAKYFETFNEDYQLPRLSEPTDKVRATFILSRTVINGLKKLVSTRYPTLAYVSSFTVACAYIWNCLANIGNNELAQFIFVVNCRSRMDPPIPAAYFGNCLMPCMTLARTDIIKEKEGFLTAAKLIGENLNKMINDEDGVVKDYSGLFPDGMPTTVISVAGTPKINFYEFDFGFGKPRKHEIISIDYNGSISMSASKESNEDLEIGVCLPRSEMDVFVGNFNTGIESYI